MSKAQWLIRARYAACDYGVITQKGEELVFNNEEEARSWGRANLEDTTKGFSKYLVAWEPIKLSQAKQFGYL